MGNSNSEVYLDRATIQPVNIVLYRLGTRNLSASLAVDARLNEHRDVFSRGVVEYSQFNRICIAVALPCELKKHLFADKIMNLTAPFAAFIHDQLAIIQGNNKIPVFNPYYDHNHSYAVKFGLLKYIPGPIDTEEIACFEVDSENISCCSLTEIIKKSVNVKVLPVIFDTPKIRHADDYSKLAPEILESASNEVCQKWTFCLENLYNWMSSVHKLPFSKIYDNLLPVFYETGHVLYDNKRNSRLKVELDIAFDILDINKNGTIELSELVTAADKLNAVMRTNFTPEQIKLIFTASDSNNDGVLQKEEFASLWGNALEKAENLQKYGIEFLSASFVDFTLRKIGIIHPDQPLLPYPTSFLSKTDLMLNNNTLIDSGRSVYISKRYKLFENPHDIILD